MIRLTSKELVNDLIRIGCVPNKTFKIQFPKIDENLYNHFMIGYFDDDGSISIIKKNNQKQVVILDNYGFLCEFQNILMDYCEINKTKITKKKIFIIYNILVMSMQEKLENFFIKIILLV